MSIDADLANDILEARSLGVVIFCCRGRIRPQGRPIDPAALLRRFGPPAVDVTVRALGEEPGEQEKADDSRPRRA